MPNQELNLALGDEDLPGFFVLDVEIAAPYLQETEFPDERFKRMMGSAPPAERRRFAQDYFDVAEALRRLAIAAPAGEATDAHCWPIQDPLEKLNISDLIELISDRELCEVGIKPLLEEAAWRMVKLAWRVAGISQILSAEKVGQTNQRHRTSNRIPSSINLARHRATR